jgi:hypothetical protein
MIGGISLSGAPAGRWTLDHDGHRLQVETGRAGWDRVARLFVDGAPAGEATTDWLRTTLPYGDLTVVVVFDALGFVDGQAARCDLTRDNANDKDDNANDDGEEWEPVAFEAAAGTRAARREALARAHPSLYASRHVAEAVGRVAFPLLGVGALVKVLLDLVPRPDVSVPDLDPPSIPWPDLPFPDLPWPQVSLPDVSPPPWLAAILGTTKLWAPIVVAVVVAVREARRRRRTSAKDAPPEDPPTDPRPGAGT